ncbi:MAG: type II toxin-antitoxin system RelE family toxin [Candidatus Aminicenantes bacterium]
MQKRKWKVELSKEALKYLKKQEKKAALRILSRLDELEETPSPFAHKDVRPLTGKLRGFYRLRVAGVRIIFELDKADKRIGVHHIITYMHLL